MEELARDPSGWRFTCHVSRGSVYCGYRSETTTYRRAALIQRIHHHRHRRGLAPMPWHPIEKE